MRIYLNLAAQHIGWHFKKHWRIQSVRIPRDTGAAAELEKFGITAKNVLDDIAKGNNIERDEQWRQIIPTQNRAERTCRVYGEGNVLLEGMKQAQVLTKTCEIEQFPAGIQEYLERLHLPENVNRNIENAIMSSLVFDTEQVKLPRVNLIDRPAFTLPRDYGISHDRRIRLLLNKLVFECEKHSGRSTTKQRQMFDNAQFNVVLTREDKPLQFSVKADKYMTSTRALQSVRGSFEQTLPDLYPMKCTISIPTKTIGISDSLHTPLQAFQDVAHPHTIFINFNKESVRNLHETPVTDSQLQSRTLLNSFAVTAAHAKRKYGENFADVLPEPILVQSVQTDGRLYHFGVFQLNTLALDVKEGVKNYWFHKPVMGLYEECGIKSGKPYIVGYNQDVFRVLLAFYSS